MTEPKMFVRYRRVGGVRITPQTRAGWLVMVLFLAVTLIPAVSLAWIMPRWPWFMPAYAIVMPILTIGFVIFAWRNADVVDVRASAAELAEFREWKRSKRGGGR